MPNGGLRMVENSLKAYGDEPTPSSPASSAPTARRTTRVSSTPTPPRCAARKAGIITGLPDAYGRGRIIGDYRRVALYGTARPTATERAERALQDAEPSTEHVIRDREELAEQIRALDELTRMAATYGCDVSRPATTAHEAVQWLYLGYLAAVKEQNGAAMSLGRTSTFLDVYLQRDLAEGILDETRAQELVDDFVIKLRIVRFLRTPEYDALFSGDPTWVTELLGGLGRTAGRWSPAPPSASCRPCTTSARPPEPNLTVLWSPRLPTGFKEFCAKVSIDTSAVQYESDELTRPRTGDDTAIACCVSAMAVGRQMESARVNLAKALLYLINGGRDELTGEQIAPEAPALTGEYLEYEELSTAYYCMLDGSPRPTSTRSTSSTTCTTSTPTMHPDGTARPSGAPLHGLWHRGSVGRRRQSVRRQARSGEGDQGRHRPGRRLQQPKEGDWPAYGR